jgi:DNA-binding CsgD family transcriptional regulator
VARVHAAGRSQREIARLLGVSKGTVANQLRQLRERRAA